MLKYLRNPTRLGAIDYLLPQDPVNPDVEPHAEAKPMNPAP